MNKKNAPASNANESAQEQRRFYTDNPRHCRALALLLQRPARREEVDRAAGASNGPELVAELRRRGLDVPCERVPAIDRDGRACRPGVYHLTASDRRKVSRWMYARKQHGCITPHMLGFIAVVAPALALLAAGWLS